LAQVFSFLISRNKEKIKLLFEKIKNAHDIYVRCSNEKQIAILGAFERVFVELEQLGVERAMSESLLIWGKEFADSLKKEFVSNQPIVPVGSEQLITNIRTNPTVPGAPATIEDAERIFEAKSEPLTPKEQRKFNLAMKHGALVYRPLPTTGDTVKIEVLVKSSQGKLPIDK
jgi:hypothetical protein